MTTLNKFTKASQNMRFYFTRVGDISVTVYDRLTHRPITYLNGFDEITHWVEKLSGMTQEEYYDFIFSKGLKNNVKSADSEEWFLKAWIYETEKLLIKYDLEVPDTTVVERDLEAMYTEYKAKQKRRVWTDEASNNTTTPIRKFESKQSTETTTETKEAETQTNSEVSKAPRKKLLRKNNRDNVVHEETTAETTQEAPRKTIKKSKQSASTVEADDKQTILQKLLDKLTEEKQESKITFGEYIKRKRELIAQYS